MQVIVAFHDLVRGDGIATVAVSDKYDPKVMQLCEEVESLHGHIDSVDFVDTPASAPLMPTWYELPEMLREGF